MDWIAVSWSQVDFISESIIGLWWRTNFRLPHEWAARSLDLIWIFHPCGKWNNRQFFKKFLRILVFHSTRMLWNSFSRFLVKDWSNRNILIDSKCQWPDIATKFLASSCLNLKWVFYFLKSFSSAFDVIYLAFVFPSGTGFESLTF